MNTTNSKRRIVATGISTASGLALSLRVAPCGPRKLFVNVLAGDIAVTNFEAPADAGDAALILLARDAVLAPGCELEIA